MPMVQGKLWKGKGTEETCWAHVRTVSYVIGNHLSLDDINTHVMDRVVAALQKKKKSDAKINRYLSHLRTFLVWAKGCDYRDASVTDIKFAWSKESSGRIRWIAPEEEARLQQHLPRTVWMLVKAAIETGCRRDGLITAEIGQINGNRLHLWKTKTDSPRTVPMTQETTAMLTELITTGTMPTRRDLRSWWERTKKRMGLEHDDPFVFHICRHTRATRLLDAGVDVLVIKERLGHKRLETILCYTHVKSQNLEDALLKVGKYEEQLSGNTQKSAIFLLPILSPSRGEGALFTSSNVGSMATFS